MSTLRKPKVTCWRSVRSKLSIKNLGSGTNTVVVKLACGHIRRFAWSRFQNIKDTSSLRCPECEKQFKDRIA